MSPKAISRREFLRVAGYAGAGLAAGALAVGAALVILGTAIVRVLYNAINILGISTTLEFAVVGLVILAGASAEEVIKSLTAKRRLEEVLSESGPEAYKSQG